MDEAMNLNERKELFRQLGLPRHEVHEWAKRSLEIPNFSVAYYRERRHKLRSKEISRGKVDDIIVDEIKERFQKTIKSCARSQSGPDRDRSRSRENSRLSIRAQRSRSIQRSQERVHDMHDRRKRASSTPPPPPMLRHSRRTRSRSPRQTHRHSSPIELHEPMNRNRNMQRNDRIDGFHERSSNNLDVRREFRLERQQRESSPFFELREKSIETFDHRRELAIFDNQRNDDDVLEREMRMRSQMSLDNQNVMAGLDNQTQANEWQRGDNFRTQQPFDNRRLGPAFNNQRNASEWAHEDTFRSQQSFNNRRGDPLFNKSRNSNEWEREDHLRSQQPFDHVRERSPFNRNANEWERGNSIRTDRSFDNRRLGPAFSKPRNASEWEQEDTFRAQQHLDNRRVGQHFNNEWAREYHLRSPQSDNRRHANDWERKDNKTFQNLDFPHKAVDGSFCKAVGQPKQGINEREQAKNTLTNISSFGNFDNSLQHLSTDIRVPQIDTRRLDNRSANLLENSSTNFSEKATIMPFVNTYQDPCPSKAPATVGKRGTVDRPKSNTPAESSIKNQKPNLNKSNPQLNQIENNEFHFRTAAEKRKYVMEQKKLSKKSGQPKKVKKDFIGTIDIRPSVNYPMRDNASGNNRSFQGCAEDMGHIIYHYKIPKKKSREFWESWWKTNGMIEQQALQVSDDDPELTAIIDLLENENNRNRNTKNLKDCEEALTMALNNSSQACRCVNSYEFLKALVMVNGLTESGLSRKCSTPGRRIYEKIHRVLKNVEIWYHCMALIGTWKQGYHTALTNLPEKDEAADLTQRDKVFNWLVHLSFNHLRLISDPIMNPLPMEKQLHDLYKYSRVYGGKPKVFKCPEMKRNANDAASKLIEKLEQSYKNMPNPVDFVSVANFLVARITISDSDWDVQIEKSTLNRKLDLLARLDADANVEFFEKFMLESYMCAVKLQNFAKSTHRRFKVGKRNTKLVRRFVARKDFRYVCRWILEKRMREFQNFEGIRSGEMNKEGYKMVIESDENEGGKLDSEEDDDFGDKEECVEENDDEGNNFDECNENEGDEDCIFVGEL